MKSGGTQSAGAWPTKIASAWRATFNLLLQRRQQGAVGGELAPGAFEVEIGGGAGRDLFSDQRQEIRGPRR